MSRSLRRIGRLLSGAALGLAAAGSAAADTQLGSWTASGEVTSGYQAVGGDWNSSKFEQYRDENPGAILDSRFLLEMIERPLCGIKRSLTSYKRRMRSR